MPIFNTGVTVGKINAVKGAVCSSSSWGLYYTLCWRRIELRITGYERTYFEQVGCRLGMALGAGTTPLTRQSVVCAVRMYILRAGCRVGMIFRTGITPLTGQSVVCAVRMYILRAGCRLGMIFHAGITPLTGTVCCLCCTDVHTSSRL